MAPWARVARVSHADDGIFCGADCGCSRRTGLSGDAFRRDTETQAEAPAYSAKAAGSRAAAATETVLVAAPSLVIASLVGQKGPR